MVAAPAPDTATVTSPIGLPTSSRPLSSAAALMIGLARSFAVYLMPELEVLMPYLIMVAVLLVRSARLSVADADSGAAVARVHTARFFVEQIAPRTRAWRQAIASGSAATMALDDADW